MQRLSGFVAFSHRMCIVGARFEGFGEPCELKDLGLTVSWELLEGTIETLCKSAALLTGWMDDEAPRRRESSIDHDPHK